MKEDLGLLAGIVIGLMIAVTGIIIVNQTYGLNVEVDNPIGWVPLQPSKIPIGMTIEDLGWQIFSGFLLLMLIADLIAVFLVLFFRGSMLPTFFIFVIMKLIAFSLGFWIGSLVVAM